MEFPHEYFSGHFRVGVALSLRPLRNVNTGLIKWGIRLAWRWVRGKRVGL